MRRHRAPLFDTGVSYRVCAGLDCEDIVVVEKESPDWMRWEKRVRNVRALKRDGSMVVQVDRQVSENCKKIL